MGVGVGVGVGVGMEVAVGVGAGWWVWLGVRGCLDEAVWVWVCGCVGVWMCGCVGVREWMRVRVCGCAGAGVRVLVSASGHLLGTQLAVHRHHAPKGVRVCGRRQGNGGDVIIYLLHGTNDLVTQCRDFVG